MACELSAAHTDIVVCFAKTSYTRKMSDLAKVLDSARSDNILTMIVSLRHLLGWLVSAFSSREDLILENLALRQQLLSLHANRPRRRLTALHRLFWVPCGRSGPDGRSLSSGHSENRGELASGWVSFVLDLGLESQTSRRT